MTVKHRWNDKDRGKLKRLKKKPCPAANLSTTNPTWTGPGLNTGLQSDRSVTNCLSHGMPRNDLV